MAAPMAYATPDDLKAIAINADALIDVPTSALEQALEDASALADGYLRTRYVLPIAPPYPGDLKLRVCQLAAHLALSARGYSPEANPSIWNNFKDAERWLERIADNKVHPLLGDSGSNAPRSRAPRVRSKTPRGW